MCRDPSESTTIEVSEMFCVIWSHFDDHCFDCSSAMEEREVNALRRNYCRLIRDLDAREVIDNLYEARALSEDDIEDILACSTSREQNRKLLYILRHRPPNQKSFSKFCCALDEYYDDLADKIRQSCELGQIPEGHEQSVHETSKDICSHSSPVEHLMATQNTDLPGRRSRDSPNSWGGRRTTRAQDVPDGCGDISGASGPLADQVNDHINQVVVTDIEYINHGGKYLENVNWTSANVGEYDEVDGPCTSYSFYGDKPHTSLVPFHATNHDVIAPKQQGSELDDQFSLSRRRVNVEEDCDPVCEELDALFTPAALVPAHGGRQFRDIRLRHVFDRLSHVINRGQFERFYHYRNELLQLRPGDADLACIMLYLESCTYLFLQNEEKCEETTNNALMLVPATSAPSRFLVEIISLKCWLCLKNNRLNVLQGHLADAFQLIHQDPLTCSGKSAGWMHVNEARRMVPMLSGRDVDRSQRLRNQAISHYEKSLDHFNSDLSKDGPFGYYFAMIKLSQLRLACGDYMQTTDLQPSEEEILEAEMRLREVENSSTPLPKLLRMNYCQARADLCFRRHNIPRALDYAEEACDIARTHKCIEELRFNTTRVTFLEALLSKAGPVTTILAKQFDDSNSEVSIKSPHYRKNVNKRRQLNDSGRSRDTNFIGHMNAALGIIAILVLGAVVIWQSFLLQKLSRDL